ncbi:uncharacterized protein ARMOST_19765 [Armillaria ostoyae]|uniref:Uncharacterized protein n=1 Tax=Armillaria ostoyae TaxID=47428 RepID=A0A284S5F1_ARMOS|nr:uncharacterized protein ARMOST_19765 [Armillaria ostoyae]
MGIQRRFPYAGVLKVDICVYSLLTSPFSGSLNTIHNLSVIEDHFLTISPQASWTPEHYIQPRHMMHSLFAQVSRLSFSSSQNLRGIDRKVHNMKYVKVCEHLDFCLLIMPCYDPFQLLDTFMADSEYTFTLSLTICEPRLGSQSNKISWPVIHWFCDLNLSNEISLGEVEALFRIEVSLYARACQYRAPKKQLSTIVEINTMCGFDPAFEGADICTYFDLPRMEIFENPVEAFPDREFNEIAMPMPVNDRRDIMDAAPVTNIQAEKEQPVSRTQNRIIVVLIALNVLFISLVIHLSIRV